MAISICGLTIISAGIESILILNPSEIGLESHNINLIVQAVLHAMTAIISVLPLIRMPKPQQQSENLHFSIELKAMLCLGSVFYVFCIIMIMASVLPEEAKKNSESLKITQLINSIVLMIAVICQSLYVMQFHGIEKVFIYYPFHAAYAHMAQLNSVNK